MNANVQEIFEQDLWNKPPLKIKMGSREPKGSAQKVPVHGISKTLANLREKQGLHFVICALSCLFDFSTESLIQTWGLITSSRLVGGSIMAQSVHFHGSLPPHVPCARDPMNVSCPSCASYLSCPHKSEHLAVPTQVSSWRDGRR